jgi:Caudovirales tail fibre assembly protein.
MKEFIYSAKNNAFYPVDMFSDYESAGTWPDDGKEVDREVFVEFTCATPVGKVRQAGPDGLPAWGDLPPLTKQERIAQAEAKRQQQLDAANSVTADWRTELALGIISDKDKADLIKWMAYIKEVKLLDISNAPDIAWPTQPAV